MLENPYDTQAQLDVKLIDGFIRFLEKLKLHERCDVQNVLDGDSKLYKMCCGHSIQNPTKQSA